MRGTCDDASADADGGDDDGESEVAGAAFDGESVVADKTWGLSCTFKELWLTEGTDVWDFLSNAILDKTHITIIFFDKDEDGVSPCRDILTALAGASNDYSDRGEITRSSMQKIDEERVTVKVAPGCFVMVRDWMIPQIGQCTFALQTRDRLATCRPHAP